MNQDVRGLPFAAGTNRLSRADGTPVLEIERVGKVFNVAGRRVEALRDVSLSVQAGEFVAIVGASGCGKSTLLRLILGLDTEYDGDIRLNGERVRKPGLDRGIVFQEHRLLPWLTAEGNVAAALRRSGLPAAERRRLVADNLALVNRPRFLLLDEPLGALDALTRLRLQDELARIVRHEGTTALLVTHDVDEAVFLADRIVVLRPNPGRVAQIFEVDLGPHRNRSAPDFVRLRDAVLETLGVRAPATPNPNQH